MGAHEFQTVGIGKTASEAYDNAVEEALYECGHDTYNGTISTTSGFKITPLDQKAFTSKAIGRWVANAINKTTKWEECHCLELPKSHKFSKRTKRGIRAFIFVGWAAS